MVVGFLEILILGLVVLIPVAAGLVLVTIMPGLYGRSKK